MAAYQHILQHDGSTGGGGVPPVLPPVRIGSGRGGVARSLGFQPPRSGSSSGGGSLGVGRGLPRAPDATGFAQRGSVPHPAPAPTISVPRPPVPTGAQVRRGVRRRQPAAPAAAASEDGADDNFDMNEAAADDDNAFQGQRSSRNQQVQSAAK